MVSSNFRNHTHLRCEGLTIRVPSAMFERRNTPLFCHAKVLAVSDSYQETEISRKLLLNPDKYHGTD